MYVQTNKEKNSKKCVFRIPADCYNYLFFVFVREKERETACSYLSRHPASVVILHSHDYHQHLEDTWWSSPNNNTAAHTHKHTSSLCWPYKSTHAHTHTHFYSVVKSHYLTTDHVLNIKSYWFKAVKLTKYIVSTQLKNINAKKVLTP